LGAVELLAGRGFVFAEENREVALRRRRIEQYCQ
jgi:hypothetical protein